MRFLSSASEASSESGAIRQWCGRGAESPGHHRTDVPFPLWFRPITGELAACWRCFQEEFDHRWWAVRRLINRIHINSHINTVSHNAVFMVCHLISEVMLTDHNKWFDWHLSAQVQFHHESSVRWELVCCSIWVVCMMGWRNRSGAVILSDRASTSLSKKLRPVH